MHFDIISIFPQFFDSLLAESIVARALKEQQITVTIHDLRKWTNDKRGTLDDRPFGGGPGMLMMVEPIYKALKELGVYPTRPSDTKVILTAAGGQTWNQQMAKTFSSEVKRMVIICGHYEGVDQRVSEHLIDMEISIGDYVLTGGELAAGIMIDSITRLLPGVLGNPDSLNEESHNNPETAEYPQYTRPAEFVTEEGETWKTPDILLSGNHAAIQNWKAALVSKSGSNSD